MSFKDLSIKNEYRSFNDNIVKDFYIPVLGEAILYQRAVGFFSSSALVMLANGIEGLIKNGGRIEIVASPRLSKEDVDEISRGYELRKVIEQALLRELDALPVECETLSYVASLVATGKLDIKIAFLSSHKEIAMYHEKMGLMMDGDGNVIAFSGSMNESENAFSMNYEAFDVFCSWTEDKKRVQKKQLAFQAIWEDYEPGIQTIEFPDAVRRKLYSYNQELAGRYPEVSEQENFNAHPKGAMYLPVHFHARPYQENAVVEWKKHGYRGIFDMATGTGKTLTALLGLWQLFTDNQERLAIIITCPYQHLVDQWVEDIETFGIRPIIGYSDSPQKKWKKNLEQAVRSFRLGVLNFFCFITTNASFVTKKVQEQMGLLGADTVYVVDEAHNMGAGYYRKYLPENIGYRLALSATLERYQDEAGTAALSSYFGEKCITYSLKEAIRSGMLTRYYYYPILTYFDRNELDDYLGLTVQISQAMKKKNGKMVLSEYAKQLLMNVNNPICIFKDPVRKISLNVRFEQERLIVPVKGNLHFHDLAGNAFIILFYQFRIIIGVAIFRNGISGAECVRRFPHFRKTFPHGIQGRFAGVELCHSYQDAVNAHFRVSDRDLCGGVGQIQSVFDDDGFTVDLFQCRRNSGVIIIRDNRFLTNGGNVSAGCSFLGFPVGFLVRQIFE